MKYHEDTIRVANLAREALQGKMKKSTEGITAHIEHGGVSYRFDKTDGWRVKARPTKSLRFHYRGPYCHMSSTKFGISSKWFLRAIDRCRCLAMADIEHDKGLIELSEVIEKLNKKQHKTLVSIITVGNMQDVYGSMTLEDVDRYHAIIKTLKETVK